MIIMRNKNPFFSVIVPIYNNEYDLEKCINSILAQTYANFELILVDDGSTDRSPQICDQFACMDKRIRVIHKKKNAGVVAARNDGLFQASGKYIYYVDGDDWIAEELLEEAGRILDVEDPPDIFAFCLILVQESGYIRRNLQVKEGLYNRERLEKEIFPELICIIKGAIQRGKCSASLADKIILRELLEKHYCRDISLFRGEDSACSYECMLFAEKVYFSGRAMYYYNRLSGSSTMKKYHANLYELNKALAEYLRNHLKAGEPYQIERQISASEFRGLVAVIHQEIDFKHPLHKAALFLREKCRNEKIIFWSKGLPLQTYPYIILLNLRCFGILLLWGMGGYLINDILYWFKHNLAMKKSD